MNLNKKFSRIKDEDVTIYIRTYKDIVRMYQEISNTSLYVIISRKSKCFVILSF